MTVTAESMGPYHIEHPEDVDLIRETDPNFGRIVYLEGIATLTERGARDIYGSIESERLWHPYSKSTRLVRDATYDSVREGVEAAAQRMEAGEALTYSIRALPSHGDSESWIYGGIHLEPGPGSEGGTTGRMAYWMSEGVSGRGYATLAAVALIKYASSKLEIDTVELPIVKYAPAYRRVAEKVSAYVADDPALSVAITTFSPEAVTS